MTVFIDISRDLLPVLAHSLWQTIVVAFVIAMILRRLSARRSNLRYLISCCGLLVVAAAALATWSITRLESDVTKAEHQVNIAATTVESKATHPAEFRAPQPIDTKPRAESASSSWPDRLNSRRLAPWLIAIWTAGVIIMMLRAVRGFADVRHWLKHPDRSFAEQLTGLEELLVELSQTLGLRRPVKLVASAAARTPAVVGNCWPVIVLPASMLSGANMTTEQWKVVLAHELAHVRRFDGLVNLAQLLIESLLFFNPAVWWISRRIRVEREACCDAVAARLTGKPTTVAATLLNVAESLTAPHTLPAMSFAEPSDSGSLRDRVTRLAKPDSVPRTSLTWMGLAASLLLLAAVAFALQQGTDVAVRSAAALLSNEERVNELARLQAENTDIIAPPANDGDDAEFVAEQTIPVTVRLRTEDGELVPKGVWLYNAQSRSMGTLASVHKPVEVFEHTKSFRPGRLRIGAFAAGYAPAISDVLRIKAGDQPHTTELILGRGFETSIAVRTPNGRPVDDVQIRVQGTLELDGGKCGPNTEQQTLTVTDGVLQLPGVSRNTVYQFTILEPGWEFERREFRFDSEVGKVWKIKRAKPTKLRLVDNETNEPITNGQVLLTGWASLNANGGSSLHYGDPRNHEPAVDTILGGSDAQGRITINRLSRRLKHTLAIRANGYRLKLLWSVQSGANLGEIRLLKPLTLSGRITGDLNQLPKSKHSGKETRRLGYRNDIRMQDETTYSGQHYTAVSDDGRFEITDLVPGSVELELPGGMETVPISESISGLEFHIETPEENAPVTKRKVSVQLTGLPEDLKVRGSLQMLWWGGGPSGNKVVPIRNNRATIDVPTGCKLNVRTRAPAGFIAKDFEPTTIPEGDQPLVVELPAIPAGAVHGTVLRADGQPATDVSVHVFSDRSKINLHKLQIDQTTSNQSDSYFQSLPYGSSYCVLVREVTSEHFTWAVSDEFTVSADNPIHELNLQLRPTRPFRARVVDEDNQPVPNAVVNLLIGHTFRDQSAGRSISRVSDDNGHIDFDLVAMDDHPEPAEATVRLFVAPVNGLRGQVVEIDEAVDIVTVVLEPGVKASGVLIDDATGQPIPDAPVRVYPRDQDQSKYFNNIRTRTDRQGRFEFSGLEPIEYIGRVDGATTPDAVVTPSPNGGNRMAYPDGHQPLLLDPDSGPVEWRVQILPGSKLTPLPAR